jgi:major membrane immunogen (membrane-anchored lipoprotein)
MKTKIFISVAIALLLLFADCSKSVNEPGISNIDWNDKEHRAEQFVTALVNGDYSIAEEGFDANMKKALGKNGLKRAWESMVKAAGPFVSVAGTKTEPNDDYEIYIVTSRHEKSGRASRIVFSKDDLIAGLFFSFVDNPL